MRKNLKKKYAAKGQLVEWYVDEIENLFAIGGVKGDLTDPTALFEAFRESARRNISVQEA